MTDSRAVPATRGLPGGGGQVLRRGFLTMGIVFAVLLVGSTAVGVAMLAPIERGQRIVVPVFVAMGGAAVSTLLLVVCAVLARSAVRGDQVDVRQMTRAGTVARAAQLMAIGAGLGTLIVGVLLSMDDVPIAWLLGISLGAAVAGIAAGGSSLRGLIRKSAG